MNRITSQTQNRVKTDPLAASGILQRKCACSSHTVAGGKCTDCIERELSLQRKAANTGKLGLPIQRKLTIGASDDPLEQEADRFADQVMLMPANAAANRAPLSIQRFTRSPTGAITDVPSSVDRVLSSPGRQLQPELRQDMERRFGYDFSRVRIHDDALASESAWEMSANAYTVGQNIVFGGKQFVPETNEGRRLIAHELVHVVQQFGAKQNYMNRQDSENVGFSNNHLSVPKNSPLLLQRQEIPPGQSAPPIGAQTATMAGASSGAIHQEGWREIHDPNLPGKVREMFGLLMNRVRRIEQSSSTESLRGFDVAAVARVEDSNGILLYEIAGQHGPVHAEVDATRQITRGLQSRRITPQITQNGHLTILVTKAPCSNCAESIRTLAEQLGIPAENVKVYYVVREDIRPARAGIAVSGRTTIRTRLSEPVLINGVNIFSISLGVISMGTSAYAEARRTERQLREEGFAPPGAAAYSDEPWYMLLARLITGELLFAEAFGSYQFDPARFNMSRWRENVREQARAVAIGGTLSVDWISLDCESQTSLTHNLVIYTHGSDGRWNPSPPVFANGSRVPDLNRIIDTSVGNDEIQIMLRRPCGPIA